MTIEDRDFYHKIYRMFKAVPLFRVDRDVDVIDLDRVQAQLERDGFEIIVKPDYIRVNPPNAAGNEMITSVVHGRKRWYAFSTMPLHSYIDKKSDIINTGKGMAPLSQHRARFLCFKYTLNWIVNYNKQ